MSITLSSPVYACLMISSLLLFLVVVPFLNSCYVLRVDTVAEKQLLFGGMYSQKGYGQEQQVPMACGVHQN